MPTSTHPLDTLRVLWDEKRAARAMPPWSAFGVHNLRPWLGHLALIAEPGTANPMFRLCGTDLHARFGGEFTRREIAALQPGIGAPLCALLREVARLKTPLRDQFEGLVAAKPVRFWDLYLPLSDDGVGVDLVLLGSYIAPLAEAS